MARWRTPELSSAATNPGRDSALGAWQWRVPGQRSYRPWGPMIPFISNRLKACGFLLSVLFVSNLIVGLELLGVLWDFILGSVSSPSISDFMILHHFKITFHPTCLDIMNWLLTKACTAFTSESPPLASPSCQFPISRRGRSRAMPLQEEEMLRPRWCKMLPVKVAPDGQVLTVWNLDPLHPGCCTFEGWKKIKHFESTSPLSPLLG